MKKSPAQAVFYKASLAGVAAAFGAALLTGCGSGGGTAPAVGGLGLSSASGTAANRAKGSVTFSVKWPEPTRLVPSAANSIVITITRVADPTVNLPAPAPITKTLTRPAAGQPLTTTVTFTNLELGKYVAVAQAFPSTDGSGVAQAAGPVTGVLGTATLPVTVAPGNNTLNIVMNSTITALTVTPATGPNLRASDTRQFIVTATDANGAVVIIGPSIVWSATGAGGAPGPFAVSPATGTTTTLSYTGGTLSAAATATVTARDTESGLSASATATFVPVGPVSPIVTPTSPFITWGKFHGNAQNTGQIPYGGGFVKPTGKLAPNFPIATMAQVEFSSPAIAINATGAVSTIYVGANDNNLYAFRPDGTVKWKFATGGFIESSPSLGVDGTIYFGSLDGNVYALKDNGTSASVIWQQTLSGPVWGSPTIDKQGYLYIGCTTPSRDFYKIDALNGAIIWKSTEQAVVRAGFDNGTQDAPALNSAETLVYFGSLDGTVYALRTSDGVQQWGQSTGAPIFSSSPAVATVNGQETVFIGSLDGVMYALDAQGGGSVWTYNTGSPIYTSPAVAANPSQANSLAVYFATFDSVGGSGNVVYGISAAPVSSTVKQPQSVYFAQTFPQGFTASPAVSPDGLQIYLGSYDGNIYGLNTSDGSTAFTYSTPSVPIGSLPEQFDSSPALAPDGTIYVGGFSGNLYGIK